MFDQAQRSYRTSGSAYQRVVHQGLFAAGDELLIRTARLLKRSLRSDDIVARIGGDEFAVLMPHTDEKALKVTISRIRAAIVEALDAKEAGEERVIVFNWSGHGLLDLAAACHAASGGRFDVTSGVLRRAWTFDGGTRVPTDAQIAALLPLVGWEKVTWRRPELTLPASQRLIQFSFQGRSPSQTELQVQILVNDRLIDTVYFGEAWQNIQIASVEIQPGENVIRFRMPDIAPSDRTASLAMKNLHLIYRYYLMRHAFLIGRFFRKILTCLFSRFKKRYLSRKIS